MKRALRIAIEAATLPIDEKGLLIDAVLGLDGSFDRALAECPVDTMPDRPLSEILADIESGVPLEPDETDLGLRLAERIPHGRRVRSRTSATI